jgi:tetratricopeptide (TPR) repeat protein
MRTFLLVTCCLFAACRKEDALLHLERAKTALYEQRPEVALTEYKQALDLLERDDSAQTPVYRARALRGAADTYYLQLRDFKHAVEVYRELIKLCPEAPETLEGRLHLATVLRHEFRDVRGSIAELTAALARNPPQSAELSYQVAAMYFELQDYKQCEIEAANVVRKFETSAFVDDALFLRAQALSMMDDRKTEAQRTFLEVIERFPDSQLKPYAQFELGRMRASAGDFEKAIEYWVAALATHPDPSIVQANIARVRARLRETTPKKVGDAVAAFDWDKHPVIEKPLPPPKNSIEAVGGSPEEAAREAKMPAEHGSPPPGSEAAPAPAPARAPGPGPAPTPRGEGNL